MASIAEDPGGRRRILFVAPGGKRKAIRLGKVPQKAAEKVKHKVESLLASKITGDAIDADTARWVAGLPDELADKLAAVGLIPERRGGEHRLVAFLEAHIAGRANLKPNTRRNYETTRGHLIAHFGSDKPLSTITPGDADQWREALMAGGLSAATVSREVKRARQFFRAAVRRKIIPENPFADVSAPAQVNSSRDYFVTRDVTAKVIDACPDAEWRLIVALSRYGGLRCPSEHLALRCEPTWTGQPTGSASGAPKRSTTRAGTLA